MLAGEEHQSKTPECESTLGYGFLVLPCCMRTCHVRVRLVSYQCMAAHAIRREDAAVLSRSRSELRR